MSSTHHPSEHQHPSSESSHSTFEENYSFPSRIIRSMLDRVLQGYFASGLSSSDDEGQSYDYTIGQPYYFTNHRSGMTATVMIANDPDNQDPRSGNLRKRPFPASKASIEMMPLVKVTEEGAECSICLTGYGSLEEVKQMPCKHGYHPGCIEKWLRIHRTCPVCRYAMPVEERLTEKIAGEDSGLGDDEENEGYEGGNLTVYVFFSRTNRNRNRRPAELVHDQENESPDAMEIEDNICDDFIYGGENI